MNKLKLTVSILIPLVIGAVAGYFTTDGVQGWYAVANKPWFNPPNWIFAPMWTALYILMGIAFYIVWNTVISSEEKRPAIIFYILQLVFNFFWSYIFFSQKQTGWAFAEILLMWLAILLTIFAFGRINKTAAWLMVPYICWVSFAAVLNYYIWQLN